MSVGNVVSAALRIYRDRFKTYYGIALKAYVWILVPIYGWAKFAALSALISRLAYQEVLGRPEAVADAQRAINRKLWQYLLLGILVGVILVGISLVDFGLAALIIFALFAGANSLNSPPAMIVAVLAGLVILVVALIVYISFLARFFCAEIPLATEDTAGLTASASLGRSWQLSQGYSRPMLLIITIAFFLTLPISIVLNLLSFATQTVTSLMFDPGDPLFLLVFYAINLPLTFLLGAVLIPFWQSLKAVIYYDLRSRKEGIELKLRNTPEPQDRMHG
jgi:hypothetical protein